MKLFPHQTAFQWHMARYQLCIIIIIIVVFCRTFFSSGCLPHKTAFSIRLHSPPSDCFSNRLLSHQTVFPSDCFLSRLHSPAFECFPVRLLYLSDWSCWSVWQVFEPTLISLASRTNFLWTCCDLRFRVRFSTDILYKLCLLDLRLRIVLSSLFSVYVWTPTAM